MLPEVGRMKTLGLWEYVFIRRKDSGKWKRFKAKLDTGAFWSRIGAKEAAALKLGPITSTRKIRTGSGSETRVVVPAKVWIGGRRIAVSFTVTTRRAGILIGRRTMGKRFKVSPAQRYLAGSPDKLHR